MVAVKNLLNAIPELNSKISEVENLTTQFSPISNVSENIRKIKELIREARDAANRVSAPLSTTCIIQLNTLTQCITSLLVLIYIFHVSRLRSR